MKKNQGNGMPTYIVKNNADFSLPIELSDSDLHHLRKVLRINLGETIYVTNNLGKIATLKVTNTNPIAFEILEIKTGEKVAPITVFFPLIQQSHLEWGVQKLTELNIENIQFVNYERCQYKSFSEKKWERLLKVSETAQIQCGRSYTLKIKKPISFKDIPFDNKSFIAAHPYQGKPLAEIQKTVKLNQQQNILIGPEGGLSEKEIQTLQDHKVCFVNLGQVILRAETAAIVMASLFKKYD